MPLIANKKSTKIFVIADVNPLRAYGAIQYLCEALYERDISVELLAPIPKKMLGETKTWPFKVISLIDSWYFETKKLKWAAYRFYDFIINLHVINKIQKMASECDAILITNFSLFPAAAKLKKMYPEIPLINYCFELFTPEEQPKLRQVLTYYKVCANIPNMVIDVDVDRAMIREEKFSLSERPLIIPNTLPSNRVPTQRPLGTLAAISGGAFPKGKPVLVYSGGAYYDRGFDTILKALQLLDIDLFFLAFCYGREKEIKKLKSIFASGVGDERARICDAVPREVLLSCIHEATAGLVYYPCTHDSSDNQKFCAPSKLYEYIACGIPVVSSSNPSLVRLVNENKLGVCALDDSPVALSVAIKGLVQELATSGSRSEYLTNIFLKQFSYDVVSAAVIEKIIKLARQHR